MTDDEAIALALLAGAEYEAPANPHAMHWFLTSRPMREKHGWGRTAGDAARDYISRNVPRQVSNDRPR